MKVKVDTGLHKFAPRAWQKVHNLTGDYVFDGSIENGMHPRNLQLAAKLGMHISGSSYGYRTPYGGYAGLSGDD